MWRIDGAVALAKALEHSYAERRRKYAIANRLESNGKTIDETAPIEAFYYYPEVDAMPADEDEEE